MTKAEIREIYLDKRLAIPESELSRLNEQLCEQFFQSIDISHINNLHIFLSLKSKKEPDTNGIIKRITSDFPQIKMIIPKINDQGTLDHFFLEDNHSMQDNQLGIREPVTGTQALPTEIDMVIVPLIAVDVDGNRVGFGKGFYDRFLSVCRPDCIKIGLSLFAPLEEKIPAESHDVALDACVYPNGFRTF